MAKNKASPSPKPPSRDAHLLLLRPSCRRMSATAKVPHAKRTTLFNFDWLNRFLSPCYEAQRLLNGVNDTGHKTSATIIKCRMSVSLISVR